VYDHVLVGTDGSDTASRAVRAAAQLAQVHQAKLTIAHAFHPRRRAEIVDRRAAAELHWMLTPGAAAEVLVQRAVHDAQAAACGGLDAAGRAEVGDPLTVLRSLIRELRPDVVVVGNADLRRPRLRRSLGHALSCREHIDVIVVDTAGVDQAGSRSDWSAA